MGETTSPLSRTPVFLIRRIITVMSGLLTPLGRGYTALTEDIDSLDGGT